MFTNCYFWRRTEKIETEQRLISVSWVEPNFIRMKVSSDKVTKKIDIRNREVERGFRANLEFYNYAEAHWNSLNDYFSSIADQMSFIPCGMLVNHGDSKSGFKNKCKRAI